MENIEEQILSYPHLSVEKKREVESYVETHPRWASLLRDVRAFEEVGAENGTAAGVHRVVRAFLVAQHVEETPAGVFEGCAHLKHTLAETDEMKALADDIRRRIQRAEFEVDPVSHFEALTGRSLSGSPKPSSDQEASTPSRPEHDSHSTEDDPRSTWSFLDRLRGLPMILQGAGAVLVLLLVTYATLFAASWASQSPLDRMAAINVSGQMVESYYSTNTRGAARSADEEAVSSIYLETLSTLRGARTSTFGLFPHFNADSLAQAKQGLKRVLDRTPEGSFLALEAHFYLGKVHLAQRDLASARGCFRTVVEGNGRRADDARRILNTLETTSRDRLQGDSSSMG